MGEYMGTRAYVTFGKLEILQDVASTEFRRNFGVTAVVCQKAPIDPIQALFLDKVREYAKKSKAAGGKLIDATPDVEKELQGELDKLNGKYGVTGPDFLKFPTFTFSDKPLQPVGLNVDIKAPAEQTFGAEATEADADEANRPWWKAR